MSPLCTQETWNDNFVTPYVSPQLKYRCKDMCPTEFALPISEAGNAKMKLGRMVVKELYLHLQSCFQLSTSFKEDTKF
jgi:hypothetical protein